jgi:hypothetical protein
VTEALAEVETPEAADEDVAWAELVAYCCRASMNSDSSRAPSVEGAEPVAAAVEALLAELELAESVASAGGAPPPPW